MEISSTDHNVFIQNSQKMNIVHDASVDLIVTSPPYPMIKMWNDLFISLNHEIEEKLSIDGRSAFNLMHHELDKVWLEAIRVLKPGGYICINIGDATQTINEEFQLFSNHSRIQQFMVNQGLKALPSIIWRKETNKPNKFMGSGMLPAGAYVTLEHEYILIFRKGIRRQFSKEDKQIRSQSAIFWEERNSWFSDIWFDLKGISQNLSSKSNRKRSGAFPFELAYRLISMYSIQGDTILDPFLGTGTTTLASMVTGRNSLGFELDSSILHNIENSFAELPEYSKTQVKARINEHKQFISKQKKGKYRNENYDFSVATKQEIDLLFPVIINVSRKGNMYIVNYK